MPTNRGLTFYGILQVVDGANACPPEDSTGLKGMGNRAYQEFLDDLPVRNSTAAEEKRKYRKMCQEVVGAMNYKDRSVRYVRLSVS